MALARVKVWIAEVLSFSDLNAEFNNILNNPVSLISPLTASLNVAGNTLTLDAASATSVSSTASGSWVFTSGAKTGTPGTTGTVANWSAQTFTDNATAGSGTATSFTAHAFQRPTLAATNASVVTTDAATLYVANAPAAGSNETLTNSYALWIDDGRVRLDLSSSIVSAASATLDALNLTAQTATISGSTNITTAAGFNFATIGRPTYSAASALTITNAATLYIPNAPLGAGAGPATITNAYSLWVGAGAVRFDGQVYLGAGNTFNIPRSYLAGCTLSTAGASATMSVAAGQATDSTNVAMMALAAINKTTSAWAVGSGNGGIDTGAIANTTWYHFFAIMRVDTGVVDVLFSLSATAPTMPANYTLKRRIGSGLTSGAAQWIAFIQDGDLFQLSTPVLETTSANPGINAVTQTLANVPTGVNVHAWLNGNANGMNTYLSDLATTDLAPSQTVAPLASITPSAATVGGQIRVRTNTSAQIRTRISASGAGQQLLIATLGWWDRRGQDA